MASDHVAVVKFHGHLIFILMILWLQAAALLMVVNSSYNISKPGCKDKCGNISIPYPFGMGDQNCFFDKYFNITCNETVKPPKASFYVSNRELLDINLLSSELRTTSVIASDCYDKKGNQTTGPISSIVSLEERFFFSSTRNELVAIGCDTIAGINSSNSITGCISSCNSIKDVINGSCTGRGCCRTSVPTDMIGNYGIGLKAEYNHARVWDFNPCSYAFVVEENWFKFSSIYLKDNQNRSQVPVVFDWVVGRHVTCEYAKKHLAGTSYTCGVNSDCYNPSNGYGYRCKCLDGYEGNPYLICQDINECDGSRERSCAYGALCTNTEGNYTCACPSGYYGDGTKQGIGCSRKKRKQLATIVPIGIGIGITVVLLFAFGFWLYRRLQKRKQIKLKQHYFKKNGGLLLKQKISSHDG